MSGCAKPVALEGKTAKLAFPMATNKDYLAYHKVDPVSVPLGEKIFMVVGDGPRPGRTSSRAGSHFSFRPAAHRQGLGELTSHPIGSRRFAITMASPRSRLPGRSACCAKSRVISCGVPSWVSPWRRGYPTEDGSSSAAATRELGLLVGGTLEWGETLREAIPRELLEEAGASLRSIGRLVGVFSRPDRDLRFHAVTVLIACEVELPARTAGEHARNRGGRALHRRRAAHRSRHGHRGHARRRARATPSEPILE